MTEQDTKNLSIVSSYLERCWGIREDDLAYLKERIFNPVIVPEYRNLKFDENFRASYDIEINEENYSFVKDSDKGWELFNYYFRAASAINQIGYIDYRNNKKTIGKNQKKIKKILEDFYKENFNHFRADCRNGVISTNGVTLEKKHIEDYIVKAFEHIGRYKTSSSALRVVISFNYADWLLCSTGEKWSSCLNVESGSFWYGLYSIFGDDNRALMYITSGDRKKEWNGIKVDSFMYRAWVFIGEDDKKYVSRIYPNSISLDQIKSATKDKNFVFPNIHLESKYELRPIRLRKDGLYITPYNDIVEINNSLFVKEKKLKYIIGAKGQKQIFNLNLFNTKVCHNSYYSQILHRYFESKNKIVYEYIAQSCDKCHSSSNIVNLKEFGLCNNCLKDDYARCCHCGDFYEKNNYAIIQNKKVCGYCATSKTKKCDICGELEFNDSMGFLPEYSMSFCRTCNEKRIVKCSYCKKLIIKNSKEHLHYNGNDYCRECYSENEEIKHLKICTICNELIEEKNAIIDYFENYYCEHCIQKERDKLQHFLEL